jgi:hypothetical protein
MLIVFYILTLIVFQPPAASCLSTPFIDPEGLWAIVPICLSRRTTLHTIKVPSNQENEQLLNENGYVSYVESIN